MKFFQKVRSVVASMRSAALQLLWTWTRIHRAKARPQLIAIPTTARRLRAMPHRYAQRGRYRSM